MSDDFFVSIFENAHIVRHFCSMGEAIFFLFVLTFSTFYRRVG